MGKLCFSKNKWVQLHPMQLSKKACFQLDTYWLIISLRKLKLSEIHLHCHAMYVYKFALQFIDR